MLFNIVIFIFLLFSINICVAEENINQFLDIKNIYYKYFQEANKNYNASNIFIGKYKSYKISNDADIFSNWGYNYLFYRNGVTTIEQSLSLGISQDIISKDNNKFAFSPSIYLPTIMSYNFDKLKDKMIMGSVILDQFDNDWYHFTYINNDSIVNTMANAVATTFKLSRNFNFDNLNLFTLAELELKYHFMQQEINIKTRLNIIHTDKSKDKIMLQLFKNYNNQNFFFNANYNEITYNSSDNFMVQVSYLKKVNDGYLQFAMLMETDNIRSNDNLGLVIGFWKEY